MNYDQRIKAIGEWLTDKPNGLLRRYSAPAELSPAQQIGEIEDIGKQINAAIPADINSAMLEAILAETKSEIQRRHGTRVWPSIRVIHASVSAAVDTVRGQSAQRVGSLFDLVLKAWQSGGYMARDWMRAEFAIRLAEDHGATWPQLRLRGFEIPDEYRDEAMGHKPSGYRAEQSAAILDDASKQMRLNT